MRVRIGVSNVARELEVELDDDTDTTALRQEVSDAVENDDTAMFWLTDRRGQQVGVPTDRLAYLFISSPEAEPRIGFGSQ